MMTTASKLTTKSTTQINNPYVGPRPFEVRESKVFFGRVGLYLLEPVLAFAIGALSLWAAIDDLETLRLMMPLILLIWLQVRFWRFHCMPPATVLAMFLFIVGQIFWPEPESADLSATLPNRESSLSK